MVTVVWPAAGVTLGIPIDLVRISIVFGGLGGFQPLVTLSDVSYFQVSTVDSTVTSLFGPTAHFQLVAYFFRVLGSLVRGDTLRTTSFP